MSGISIGCSSPTKPRPRNYGYDWKQVHKDLTDEKYAGVYGWDNACYWAIAERKAHVDLKDFYKKRAPDEFYLPAWKELIDNPETQKHWKGIVTFDPMGMYGTPPTIACCEARLNLPDFDDMTRDGTIVDEDGGIKVSKAAVQYAWNIPHLAERLELGEQELRDALYKYSGQSNLLDPEVKTFLPAVGGFTIYAFGDVRKLRDPSTEVAVRVHDECIGSDVFGSDICTCRPYLIFALRHAIECAQRGGVGLVVYYRKEGRSLGEVVKFRVYNARTNQAGGDTAEKYFHHTESIAGIRDARFQTMMPDALLWMGISRIDWLLSMSNEKFEAIADAGITVMQRVDLPDAEVPKAAWVEMDAKVASGYHQDAILPTEKETIREQLFQLPMIRKQCNRIYSLAKKGHLSHVILDESRLDAAVDFVENVIRDTYPTLEIPMHSRMRHFKVDILARVVENWPKNQVERCRRLIDLATVSVLLDAGAGATWKYICPWDGSVSCRSEGLAQASLDMFTDGSFSSDPAVKCRVNSLGLSNLKLDSLKRGFQVHGDNVVTGLEGRLGLLHRLGEALEDNGEFFGPTEMYRPGNVVDYVLKHVVNGRVSVSVLWHALMKGYVNIWPSRTTTNLRRGDVWVHSKIKNPAEPGSDLVPFHKLTQWLCYSLIEVMQKELGIVFDNVDQMTALAEYRNGGLLVDLGVLKLRDPRMHTFGVHAGSELVVEWRALTVVLMDRIAENLRVRLGRPDMPLSQILEGGTWRAGRKIAFSLRPDGSPPILVDSDGTVF